jgi:hypothetical protein
MRGVRILQRFSLSLALCVVTASNSVQSEESLVTSEEGERGPRHRIDITGVYLDNNSSDSVTGAIAYTYNLTDNSNLNLTVPYIDPDLDSGGDSGFGDLLLSYSISPFTRVGTHPWVPRTVGSGFAVSVPTGNADEGRSLDTWVLYPYLGVVLPVTERFFFAPQLGYQHSLGATASDVDLRLMIVETGLGFVAFNGFWISYFPRFVRDLESDEWAIDQRLSIGKMLSRRFGISLDYVAVDRFNFGEDLPAESGHDSLFEANIHFNF